MIVRHVFPLLLSIAILATPGCVSFEGRGATYSATATEAINFDDPAGDNVARTRAMFRAETQARDEILRQAAQLQLSDGRTMEMLAVSDPTVRAILDDQVRAAQITNRQYNDDGTVTVTVRMDLDPLYETIADYNEFSIR